MKMNLKAAIEWANRAEPADVFISNFPRKTQDALLVLVAEVERLKRHWIEDDRDLNELIEERDRYKAEVKRLTANNELFQAQNELDAQTHTELYEDIASLVAAFSPLLEQWRSGRHVAKICYGLNNSMMEEFDRVAKKYEGQK